MKPKVAAVLSLPTRTLWAPNRLRILDYFARCFELTIYTNKDNSYRDCGGAKIKQIEDKLSKKKIVNIRRGNQ